MEQEILNSAIDNLSSLIRITISEDLPDNTHYSFYNGAITIIANNQSYSLPFSIKKKVTLSQLPFLKEAFSGKENLIIFEYATKAVKEKLRDLEINYLEASGNVYLVHKDLFLFIDTQKRVKLSDTESNTAFSKTGLKVIYQLLQNEEAIKWNYRRLGHLSGVSIDTVSRVFRELTRDKYLVKINDREFKIFDYDRLFNDWVILFNKILRPKLKKRSFRFRNNGRIKDLLNDQIIGQIGGELAAEEISNYLIAEKVNLYLPGSFVELALSLNLIPDKNGPITMIEQFWNDDENDDKFVSFPLIYADLISDPRPRNLETAKILYKKYVYQTI